MARRRRSWMKKYWGWVLAVSAIALLIGGWISWALAMTMLTITAPYWLLWAPTWCMGDTRAGTPCRNNSYGLITGCKQVRQHRWQKITGVFYLDHWRRMAHGPRENLTMIKELLTVLTAFMSLVSVPITTTIAILVARRPR